MSLKIEVSRLAKFCNMSTETIIRFIEADYIKVLEKRDNQIFVNANEACALFGANPEKLQSELKIENQNVDEETLKEKSITSNEEEVKEEIQSKKEVEIEKPKNAIIETKEINNETSTESSESALFKKLTELQEELLKKQDLEIEDLKKQRSWLQNRVEILEQKLDREQLLLLSQTQIVNQLIKKRKISSPIQKALAWFGVPTKEEVAETQNTDNVVEMKKNSDKDAA